MTLIDVNHNLYCISCHFSHFMGFKFGGRCANSASTPCIQSILSTLAISIISSNFNNFRKFGNFSNLSILIILGGVRGITLAIFCEVIVWKGFSGLFLEKFLQYTYLSTEKMTSRLFMFNLKNMVLSPKDFCNVLKKFIYHNFWGFTCTVPAWVAWYASWVDASV